MDHTCADEIGLSNATRSRRWKPDARPPPAASGRAVVPPLRAAPANDLAAAIDTTAAGNGVKTMTKGCDVFICHASADKKSFVRPLAEALRRLGVGVWYDEFSIDVGDSVSEQIDKGIAAARFGIVVVSRAFIGRSWPEHELRGLVSRDVEQDLRILPIWHGVSKREVSEWSPSLSDKFAIDTQRDDAQEAAIKILRNVRPDLHRKHPRAELERLASGTALMELQSEIDELRRQIAEYRCPQCGAPLSTRVDAPVDAEEKYWDTIETYEMRTADVR